MDLAGLLETDIVHTRLSELVAEAVIVHFQDVLDRLGTGGRRFSAWQDEVCYVRYSVIINSDCSL